MPKNVTQLLAEIDAQLPTNGAGLINAATLRSVLDDIVNNFQVTADRINTTSGAADSTTTLYGDNSWKPAPVGTSGGGFSGNYLASNATVQAGTINYCDTSAGGFGVTIPTSPAIGNVVCFRDAVGTWDLANLSVLPGGHNIDGNSGTFTCDVADANFDLIWRGDPTGWSVQFIVAPLSRRPAIIRTGAGTSFSTANVLGIGQGTAIAGAGTAAGHAIVAGVSGSSIAANWNPSDKAADITLSLSNLKATKGGSGADSIVRGTPGRTASHRYFELTFNTLTAGPHGVGVGLANASHTLSGYLGSDSANGMGVFNGGYSQGPGWAGNFGTTFIAGDVLGIEMDTNFAGDIFRCYINGSVDVVQSGSLYGTSTWFPAVSIYTPGDAVTANFGATPFSFLPSGAQAWNAP
jgi:hypothetical protein